MLSGAHRYVAATALLLLCASVAHAQQVPTAVSPFPRGLSGTLAFQSDTRTPANPNGRVKIYTIDLSTGRVDAADPRRRLERRAAAMVARRTPHRVHVEPRRQLQPLCDGRRRRQRRRALTSHGGNDRDPVWLPDGQSLVFSSDRDRGIGRSDLYRLWLADGARRAPDGVFRGQRDHAERVAGRQLGRLHRDDVPDRIRLDVPGPRPRAGHATDVAVRRDRVRLLAELVAGRPVDRARVARQRAIAASR